MGDVTLGEAAQSLGMTRNGLKMWMRKVKPVITPRQHEYDYRVWLISQEDVDRIASARATLPRAKVARVEAKAEQVHAAKVGRLPELPDGLVAVADMAKRHGIPLRTVNTAIDDGHLVERTGQWKRGPIPVKHALDDAGQRRFLDLWGTRSDFHQCNLPMCPCHALLPEG